MASDLEYALMAGRAYFTTRSDLNRFPSPDGWAELPPDEDPDTGFEARAFIHGNEIVIAYAGTYFPSGADHQANLALGSGQYSEQLLQAANYYLSIKNNLSYAGFSISLTGHSLGGGLAALVGVFFDVTARVFAQAPFAAAARYNHLDDPAGETRVDVASRVYSELRAMGHAAADLAAFYGFIQQRGEDPHLIPNSGRVSGIHVPGDIVDMLPGDIIGSPHNELKPGGSASPTDLHSQALLSILMHNGGAFEQATQALPELLAMLFDNGLFNRSTGPTSDQRNFLDHLLRRQFGVTDSNSAPVPADAMLDRFTADLNKLADSKGAPGDTDPRLLKSLIAFAMEKYYEETQDSPGYANQLFTPVSGGVRLDTQDVAESITSAKGYADFISTLTPRDRAVLQSKVNELQDWYVALGRDGMVTADTQHRGAFMLGGYAADILVGGDGDDLLIGGPGADTLRGAQGYGTVRDLLACAA